MPTKPPPKSYVTNERLPIGAVVDPHGVHYRVWAPLHSSLEIHLRRPQEQQAMVKTMERSEEGFFEYVDREGKAGDRYRYGFSDGGVFPDPASRFQPDGVHGESETVDPRAYSWNCDTWQRPGWKGQSIYELHVGTFTDAGTYRAAIERLDHLVNLGVEAIELMPVADFPGGRNWGY